MEKKDEGAIGLELKMCRSFEEFDAILNRMKLKTDSDKIAYLKMIFDVEIVHATNNDRHTDYVAMATAIMNYA